MSSEASSHQPAGGAADHVRLEIPASPEYVVLARLAVMGIGSRIGFSYDDVEDLKVIAAEVCRLVVGESPNGDTGGRVAIEYAVGGGQLSIEASSEVAGTDEPDDLSMALLEALTDDYHVDTAGPIRRVRVTKRFPA